LNSLFHFVRDKGETLGGVLSLITFSQQRFFTGFVRGKNVALLKQIPAADYETFLALLWLIQKRFWEQGDGTRIANAYCPPYTLAPTTAFYFGKFTLRQWGVNTGKEILSRKMRIVK
jgi:hypothetical protein